MPTSLPSAPLAMVLDLDLMALGRVAAYLVGTLAIIALAKVARDAIALRRGHRLSALIADHNHTPVAVEMGGFVLALVIGLTGSIVAAPGSWWEEALALFATGAIAVAVLFVNDRLVGWLLLGRIDADRAVADEHNLAVAIVRSAANVGAALALRGALGHDSPLAERVVMVLVGQVALVLMARAYQALTPYDDQTEIRHKNAAAALPLAGILVAVGLLIGAAMEGEGAGLGEDLVSVAIDLGVSGVGLVALRWLGDKLLLPGGSFAREIAVDKNPGAGFIEGVVYVGGAVTVTFFLN